MSNAAARMSICIPVYMRAPCDLCISECRAPADVDIAFARAASKPTGSGDGGMHNRIGGDGMGGSPAAAPPSPGDGGMRIRMGGGNAPPRGRRMSVVASGLRMDFDQFCVALADISARVCVRRARRYASRPRIGKESMRAICVSVWAPHCTYAYPNARRYPSPSGPPSAGDGGMHTRVGGDGGMHNRIGGGGSVEAVSAALRTFLATHVVPLHAALSHSAATFAVDVRARVRMWLCVPECDARG